MAKLIVEICQNHRGERALLGDMIWAAAEAGADIVKGQVIFSDDLSYRERFEGGVVEHNGVRKTIQRPYGPERERLSKLDLAEDDYRFFIEECYRAGVRPMLTVFSRKRIPFAASLPWQDEKLVKVASYDCASFPMLRELTRHFDRFIVSTGGTFDDEIKQAAEILRSSAKPHAFLHCVTSYPNTLTMANLARIRWLKRFSPETGWSDHTLVERDGIKAAKLALYLGANYVERHFTILPAAETKDGSVSITPPLLRELAQFNRLTREEQLRLIKAEIPEWPAMLGQEEREMTHTEMLNRDYYRGRFASLNDGQWVYNWEEKPVGEA